MYIMQVLLNNYILVEKMIDDELAFEVELFPYHFFLPMEHNLVLDVVLEELDFLDLLEKFNLFSEFPNGVELVLLILEVCNSSKGYSQILMLVPVLIVNNVE